MIHPADYRWFGHPGHLCVRYDCHFWLCTQVGDYLISTIGEYHPRSEIGPDQVTRERWVREHWPGYSLNGDYYYETVVYRAGKVCNMPDCQCGMPELLGDCLHSTRYKLAGEAQTGHMITCLLFADR